MALTYDVAVVGCGIAGVSAALASRARGARVCLVRAAPGATALASGAWRGPLRPELRHALTAAGFPLESTRGPLTHERGHTVHADFASASHTGATADADTVIGIAGLPHFNAQTLARIWNEDAPMRAHTIELAATPAAGWSAPSLAAHIERDPAILIERLRAAEVRGKVIFPAVLGLERVADVLGALEKAGIHGAEALAATPSIPGWRLQEALDRVLAQAAVTIAPGRATLKTARGKRVEQIAVGGETIEARSFVLATGKYLGGGIIAEESFRESVLDLPVWLEQLGDVFTSPDALPLTDPVRTAEQPLMYAGVHADDEQRPVDRVHDVVYDNVFVAGTVRAGWGTADRGLGDSAEDGWRAGERATS
ncbi:MAG TPA: FAD-binding protein [Longimicrobiales bacterium]